MDGNSGRVYRRHPYSERIRAVELCNEGLSSNEVARRMGLDPSMVRSWVRKYRTYGSEALGLYWRRSGATSSEESGPSRRDDREKLFKEAFLSYATTQHSVASITRHYGLDYHSFKYYVERYHPELVAARGKIKASF